MNGWGFEKNDAIILQRNVEFEELLNVDLKKKGLIDPYVIDTSLMILELFCF